MPEFSEVSQRVVEVLIHLQRILYLTASRYKNAVNPTGFSPDRWGLRDAVICVDAARYCDFAKKISFSSGVY